MRLAACLAGWLTCLPVAKALFWKTLAPALADSQKASSDLCASADRLKLPSLPLLASQTNSTHPGASHSAANAFFSTVQQTADLTYDTRWLIEFSVQLYSCAPAIARAVWDTKESPTYLIPSWYEHLHTGHISLTEHIRSGDFNHTTGGRDAWPKTQSQCYMTEGTPWPNSRVHPHWQSTVWPKPVSLRLSPPKHTYACLRNCVRQWEG